VGEEDGKLEGAAIGDDVGPEDGIAAGIMEGGALGDDVGKEDGM